jgi:hypothetical protein
MERQTQSVHPLPCAGCARVSTAEARGWVGFLVDDPDELGEDEEPYVTFLCPACVHGEPR